MSSQGIEIVGIFLNRERTHYWYTVGEETVYMLGHMSVTGNVRHKVPDESIVHFPYRHASRTSWDSPDPLWRWMWLQSAT